MKPHFIDTLTATTADTVISNSLNRQRQAADSDAGIAIDDRDWLLGHLYGLDGVDDLANLSEPELCMLRKIALDTLEPSAMIAFQPSQRVRRTLYAFTDPECRYCRKLHGEIDAYLDAGYCVRYLAFPRNGIGSASYRNAAAIWQAADPQRALTRAKSGRPTGLPIKRRSTNGCPIAASYRVGQQIGVQGTPSLITDAGEMIPGYLPTAQILQQLEQPFSAHVASKRQWN